MIAASLTTYAAFGISLTFGGCLYGNENLNYSRLIVGLAWRCFSSCNDTRKVTKCFRFLVAGGLFVILFPSFGILHSISGGFMIKSATDNTATNAKVFAGLIAFFNYTGAIYGLLFLVES